MSVYAIEGRPGSGKTLYVISEIIAHFVSARNSRGQFTPVHIYHNIEGLSPEILCSILDLPSEFCSTYFHKLGQVITETGEEKEDLRLLRYFYYLPDSIKWGFRMDGNKKIETVESADVLPEQSLIILDETQNIFGARDFKSQYSDDVIKYLSRHRHYKHTIFWLTQSLDSVDVTFRRQTEQVLKIRRLELYGMKNSSMVEKYEGWQCDNIAPYAKKRFAYPAKFFPCYRSYQAGTDDNTKEVRLTSNIFLSHKPLMIVLVLLLLIVGFLIFAPSPLDNLATLEKNKLVETPVSPAPVPSKGFSPGEGEQGKIDTIPEVCFTSSYVMAGEVYLIVNGKPQKQKGGIKYVECSQENSVDRQSYPFGKKMF